MALFSRSEQKLLPISNVPEACMGAPAPFVLASEHTVRLFYYVDISEVDDNGMRVNAKNKEDMEVIAEITFNYSRAHYLGFPDESSNRSHELYEQYDEHNEFYAGFELISSKRDPQFRLSGFGMAEGEYKHFIFPFHDRTFEIIAKSCAARILKQPHLLDVVEDSLTDWPE